jgi:rhodanese-related sulfurtransferase/DNA-binding HxlR family transcriptional regulator
MASSDKQALFDALASVGSALGHGRRAELVDVLAQGERRVEDLAGAIGQSVANTSHHLQQLLRAGLVTTRREGTRVYYSLSGEDILALWLAMEQVAARHVAGIDALVEAYLGDRDGLEAITREQLADRLRDGDVVVVDVRPPEEYAAGHLPGAVNVPVAELPDRLDELPGGAQVVAYCRGPFCVSSDDAVRALRDAGRDALRLVDGFPEWAAAGLPVERATA